MLTNIKNCDKICEHVIKFNACSHRYYRAKRFWGSSYAVFNCVNESASYLGYNKLMTKNNYGGVF